MTTERSRGRTALLIGLMAVIALALALIGSEVLLRVVYRDGGRTTLGGPGGRDFVYTYLPGTELRGPLDTGPKTPGVRRLMVFGDSITWGQGVTAWTDTYPARLLDTLNADGRHFDMAVYAYPGKEIDNHLSTIAKSIDSVDPDLVVYQWYSNDIEISKAGRPVSRRAWRSWPGFATVRRWSYLAFALDFAFDQYLPSTGRSYLTYLEEDFAEGTPGWRTFTRTFHSWAAYATGFAPRTILMLYPAVPMTALADLRTRMTALASGQVLSVAPAEMQHPVGTTSVDGAATSVPAGTAGELSVTPGVRLAHGDYAATVQLRLDAPAQGLAARVTVSQGTDATPLGAIDVTADALGAPGAWQPVRVPFTIVPKLAGDVVVHVEALGAALSAGRVDLPVRYGIEVVDLTAPLQNMTTGASLFDAHPNAAAHAVIADVLAAAIRGPGR